jgi:hypothetical protein
MLQGLINAKGDVAGRQHIATLVKRMGIEALCRQRAAEGSLCGWTRLRACPRNVRFWLRSQGQLMADVVEKVVVAAGLKS